MAMRLKSLPKVSTPSCLINAGMKHKQSIKPSLFVALGIAALIISMICAVGLGPVAIAPRTVWCVLTNKLPLLGGGEVFWTSAVEKIITEIRLPRVLLGALVGSGLALTGVSIQAFTKNPLSDPYILGISSGASAGAVSVALMGLFSFFGFYALTSGAFIGSAAAIFLVYILSSNKDGLTPTRLVLTGVAVSALFSSVTNFVIYNAKNENGIRTAMYWMMGSLEGAKWEYLPILAVVLLLVFLFLLSFSSALDTMLLGEQTAVILGVNIKQLRRTLVILSSVLAGVVVSLSGAIGFVGLIIPHITRNLVGSGHRKVIPVAAILGAIFIIWSDVIARLVVAPEELPIGIVTSMFGAPFFIYLLRMKKYSFGG